MTEAWQQSRDKIQKIGGLEGSCTWWPCASTPLAADGALRSLSHESSNGGKRLQALAQEEPHNHWHSRARRTIITQQQKVKPTAVFSVSGSSSFGSPKAHRYMKSQPTNSSGPGTMCGTASCCLAMIAWIVIILTWAWVLTRPSGSFHDQGGLALTIIIFPLTLGAWFVGGPVALALGGRAIKRLGPGEADHSERRFARTGILLSRTLFWAGVAWLLFTILAAALA